jgi:hypothetical protein
MVELLANQAAAYPRWLVITSLVITGFVAFWFFIKICKWMFILSVIATTLIVAAGAALWFLT